MSKSMAIDSIMKIFLMIAVIIVGVSFLMKAFGIDIFAWLKNRVEGIDVPSEGKALYIRMKDSPEKDVHAFTLVDESDIGRYYTEEKERTISGQTDYSIAFQISKNGNNQYEGHCTVLTLEAVGNRFSPFYILSPVDISGLDQGYVYYVKPGTVIQANSMSLRDSLKDAVGSCDSRQAIQKNPECTLCNSKNGNAGDPSVPCEATYGVVNCAHESLTRALYPVCDDDQTVKNKFEFSPQTKIDDGCAASSLCNLLNYREIPKEAFRGSQVKYGIVCADDGLWHTCKKSGTEVKVGTKDIKCNFDGSVGTWPISQGSVVSSAIEFSDNFDSRPSGGKKGTMKDGAAWSEATRRLYLIPLSNDRGTTKGQFEYKFSDFSSSAYAINNAKISYTLQFEKHTTGTVGNSMWFYLFSKATQTDSTSNINGYKIVFEEDEIKILYGNQQLYTTSSDPTMVTARKQFINIYDGEKYQIQIVAAKVSGNIVFFVQVVNPSNQKYFTATTSIQTQNHDLSGDLFGMGAISTSTGAEKVMAIDDLSIEMFP